jgi:hypothetical protein
MMFPRALVLPAVLAAGCAPIQRVDYEVTNPLPVPRTELAAMPLGEVETELSEFDPAHVTAAVQGGVPVPAQIADLDLDGRPESLVTVVRIGPRASVELAIESPASAPASGPRVEGHGEPAVFRRIDASTQEDARLPVIVAAGVLRRPEANGGAPRFPPGTAIRVIDAGPVWAVAELHADDGAVLHIAARAGSPWLTCRLQLPTGTERIDLALPRRDESAAVERQPERRGRRAIGLWRPGSAVAAVCRTRDVIGSEILRGTLHLRGRDLTFELLCDWDGAATAFNDATAFGTWLDGEVRRQENGLRVH